MKWKDYDRIFGEEVDLKMESKNKGASGKGYVPDYRFQILLHGTETVIGHVSARIGDGEEYPLKYIGHIGYGVSEAYRGHRYAAKACRLVEKIYREHGVHNLIITCNPENISSRRTCEELGAEFIEIVDVPKDSPYYSASESKKCRYRWVFLEEADL